jgi:hypothetical protein
VDIVLLVLSIAIPSVAHVIITQRARTFICFVFRHASHVPPPTVATFTPSCQRSIHEQPNEICNGLTFSTIHRPVNWGLFRVHPCRKENHGPLWYSQRKNIGMTVNSRGLQKSYSSRLHRVSSHRHSGPSFPCVPQRLQVPLP